MDLGIASGVLGALCGVVVGSWLSDRSQRRLQRAAQRHEYLRRREEIFLDFLVAYSQMRRLLMSSPVTVRLSAAPAGRPHGTPVIDGATSAWDVLERANSGLQLVASGTPVDAAAREAMHDVFRLARLRTTLGPGEMPQQAVDESGQIVTRYIRAATDDLEAGEWRQRIGG
jgi:hypothetical protein